MLCQVSFRYAYRYTNMIAVTGWSATNGLRTFEPMPKDRGEDALFAKRMGKVLATLRSVSGWTREEAAEAMDVTLTSLGRWERGENAPKGYDLGRLYRGYSRWGADWQWFLDPPAVIPEVNPVKSRLDELERAGAIAADEREARVAARRRQASERRAASRRKRPE